MRLNPRYPFWYLFQVGLAYGMTGRYAEQLLASRRPKHNLPAPEHLDRGGFFRGQGKLDTQVHSNVATTYDV